MAISFGGVTTTVVVLPVALAFGVASGMGAAAGVYGAIAVGLFASIFGSPQSRVPGPTTATTVAMAVIVTNYAHTLGEALTIVIMAGVFQMLLGLSRIGRFVAYTPHVVVSGFMSGIGIIVIFLQVLPIIGASAAPGGMLGALRAFPEEAAGLNVSALAVAVATLAVGVLWSRRLARRAPAPLVALIAGTLLSLFWLDDVPRIGPIPGGLPELQLAVPSLGIPRAFGRTGPDLRAHRFGEQSAHFAGGGFADRQPARPEPGTGGPGNRHRRGRCHRRDCPGPAR